MSHLYIDIEDQFYRHRSRRELKTLKESHNRRPPCLVWEFSFKLAVQTDVYLTAHLIGAPETVVVCDWLLYPSHCTCGNLAAISKLIWVGQGEEISAGTISRKTSQFSAGKFSAAVERRKSRRKLLLHLYRVTLSLQQFMACSHHSPERLGSVTPD